ncbi:MAG: hypothetical protein ACI9GW_000881 [Halieaceae bacterium]
MNPIGDPLAELRDIHLPDPVDWWPPAPGWWLLAALGVALFIVLLKLALGYFKSRRYRRSSIRLLEAHYESFKTEGDALKYCQQVHVLLRRTALISFGDRAVAHLSGRDWLEFLDAQVDEGRGFTDWGAHFEELPYRPTLDELDLDALQDTTRHWLRHHRSEK